LRSSKTHIRRRLPAALAAILVAVVACENQVPTALDDGQLPDAPVTAEVFLPWSSFGTDWQVLDGFGSVAGLSAPVVAHTYAGTLESRALLRYGSFPSAIRVFDSTGVGVVDTDQTYVAGRLWVTFDTAASVAPGPVRLTLSQLQEEWHARTATWTLAIDSVGEQRAWTEPGAGPTTIASVVTWDPTLTDSVAFTLDSASMARWQDVDDLSRGARIEASTDGVRLTLARARLYVVMRPSVNADTLVEDTVALIERTSVYDPPPSDSTGGRVGGAPAARTVVGISVPPLTGPPELCAAVTCPYTIDPNQVSYAALQMTTRETEAAFRPTDSVFVDVRPVLSPDILPKSPLGNSQTGSIGIGIAPEAFAAGGSRAVDVPITLFVRAVLGGPDSDGSVPPSMISILSLREPSSLGFASFYGPAEVSEPVLRLILTAGEPQVLP